MNYKRLVNLIKNNSLISMSMTMVIMEAFEKLIWQNIGKGCLKIKNNWKNYNNIILRNMVILAKWGIMLSHIN